ncbi:patatin-like protein [Caballeronia sp. KNU42]
MNGGVSLAVWMGGVTNEIFDLVKQNHPVYQRLLSMTRSTARVDVISGTSAGGINGAALALALLYSGDFSELRSLWFKTGALANLLRPVMGKNPGSLLKGDEYFLPALTEAFEKLARAPALTFPVAATPIDLRLTTTLLTGRRGHTVDDLGVEINDVDYRANFHFIHSGVPDGDTDFSPRHEIIAHLARAARSTASFPFAFEPSLLSLDSNLDKYLEDSAGEPLKTPRYVVDGGLLDNKPFNGALKAVFGMERRGCVRRVLAYINPDPGDGPPPGMRGRKMPPVGVVVAESVLGIPQSQSISDQLAEIRDHNETVRKRRDSVATLTRCLKSVDFAVLPAQLFEVYRERRLAVTFEIFVYTALPKIVARSEDPSLAGGLRAIGKHGREQLKAIFMATPWDDWIPLRWPDSPDAPANRPQTWQWGLFPVEFAAKIMLDLLRKAQDLADYASPPLDPPAPPQPHQRKEPRAATWGDPPPRADAAWDVLGRDWDQESSSALDAPPTAIAEGLPLLWAQAYEQIRLLTAMRRDERCIWDKNGEVLLKKLSARVSAANSDPGAAATEADFLDMFMLLSDSSRRQNCAARAHAVAAIVNETSKLALDIAEKSLNSGRLRQPDMQEARDLRALAQFLHVDSMCNQDAAQIVIYKLLQLEVIEFSFNDHASLDSDTVIELAQISGDSASPIGKRCKAKEKLLGLQLAHFGAFYKESWRANDWIFGRLDGAERLVRILLNPERIHRFYFRRRKEAVAQICDIALDSITSDILQDHVAAEWQKEDYLGQIRKELSFLDTLEARLPDTLPVCAKVLTMRLHYGILRIELPELIASINADQANGADASGPSEALLRNFGGEQDVATIKSRPFSPEQARRCLESGLIADECLEDEAGSDLFTRTITHSAATLQSLLASKAAKLGPVSTLFATLKVPILGFYFVARGLTRQSRTSAALNGGILAAGLALVCFAVFVKPSSAPNSLVTFAWAMLAYGLLASVVRSPRTVGMVVWVLLLAAAIATKGLVLGAVALAVALLTLSVAFERFQWMQWLIGFIVIIVAGVWEGGMLESKDATANEQATASIHILVLAVIVCIGLLIAIWETFPISIEAERAARGHWKALTGRPGRSGGASASPPGDTTTDPDG